MWKAATSFISFLLILTTAPPGLRAEIYFYKDENRVLHITNVGARPFNSKRSRSSNPGEGIFIHFWPEIKKVSRSSGLDPVLLAALVLVESGGNPRAISQKGAMGLTQLMPMTAKALEVNPMDPEENLKGGAQYLKGLLEEFDGDLILALAAYNAGPSAVKKNGKIPPYRETRQYVRKVLLTWKQLLMHFSHE